jgi:hypothetical protein
MISTKASAVREPTPGCVLNRCASGHFSTSCSIACVSCAIVFGLWSKIPNAQSAPTSFWT